MRRAGSSRPSGLWAAALPGQRIAIAAECRRDWQALRCRVRRSALARAWRALRRSPTLHGFAAAFRTNPLVRLVTMISVMSLLFVGAVSHAPPRSVDAICIVVDSDGPHVLDERSAERTYDDLLLRRSVGDNTLQLILEPGRTVTVNHAGQIPPTPPRPSGWARSCTAAASSWVRTKWWS